MDAPDLDAMVERLRDAPNLDGDEVAEIVVTLAEHRDRRVIAPLIDLIASRRADELVVRAAGWMADVGLHPALVALRATRIGDLGEPGYWEQVDRAIGRCAPDAPARAEEIEVALPRPRSPLASAFVELKGRILGSLDRTGTMG